jgi:hypothetical protein
MLKCVGVTIIDLSSKLLPSIHDGHFFYSSYKGCSEFDFVMTFFHAKVWCNAIVENNYVYCFTIYNFTSVWDQIVH